jgi:hypothetical protein
MTEAREAEISDVIMREIASAWRLVLGAKPQHQIGLFKQSAADLWQALEIDSAVYPADAPASKLAVSDALYDLANLIGLEVDHGQALIVAAQKARNDEIGPRVNGHAVDEPPPWDPDQCRIIPAGAATPSTPITWVDMSNWDREPKPEREWAIPGRVPLNQAGLFSGEGGAGKSIVELMKDVAHVAGKEWFGSLPALGPAIYVGAEDDQKEIHIRLHDIAAHYGLTFKQLIDGGLHVLSMLGQDATLCAASRSGKVETTALYRQIYEAAGDIKPKNISVDTLTRAFSGNEIDRVQVYAFAMHMQALATVAGGSVKRQSATRFAGVAWTIKMHVTPWSIEADGTRTRKIFAVDSDSPADRSLAEDERRQHRQQPVGQIQDFKM